MYRILHRFKELLSLLFSGLFSRRRDIALPGTGELEQADRFGKNAMVGTVRNREQLLYNLSHNCYYVPARFIPQNQAPVAYIALHERDEADIPCIIRIGRVKAMERVERRTIPVTMRKETDPKELYCYYTVEEWNALPHRILIRDTARGRPLFTDKFLLEHCHVSYELFVISSQEDYRLLEGIYTLLELRGEDFPVCNITETRRLSLHNDMLVLTTQKGDPLGRVSLKAYKDSPRSSFLYLKKHLK